MGAHPVEAASVYVWVGVFDGDHFPMVEMRRASYDETGERAAREVPIVVEALEKAGFKRVDHGRPAS